MSSLASRVLGLAVLAAFIVLFLYFLKTLVMIAVVILAVAVVGGILFYFRMRLALRRFRREFEKAAGSASRRQAGRHEGEALDAEFKVKDERE